MRWPGFLLVAVLASAVGAVSFSLARTMEEHWSVSLGVRGEGVLIFLPIFVVLGYPVLVGWFGSLNGERAWTSMSEPYRRRLRSRLMRYMGLSLVWAILTLAGLYALSEKWLGVAATMAALGSVFLVMVAAGAVATRRMQEIWAEETRARG